MTRRLFAGLLSSIVLVTLVSGCGFHLRGNYPLPDILKLTHFVGSTDIEFNQLLQERLEKQGAQIVEKDQATAALIITDLKNDQEVLTKDGSGSASSYEFTYEVEYNVYDAQGAPLFEKDKKAKQTRILNYNASEELQFEEEKEFLLEDMREEVILQILRTTSSL